jgi:hypothetical protein
LGANKFQQMSAAQLNKDAPAWMHNQGC